MLWCVKGSVLDGIWNRVSHNEELYLHKCHVLLLEVTKPPVCQVDHLFYDFCH